ncbi:hypothetical protein EMCRGX_G017969 [Ephydatia muelleri]
MVTTNGDSKLLVQRSSQLLARVPRPDYTYDVVEAGYPLNPSNGLCGTFCPCYGSYSCPCYYSVFLQLSPLMFLQLSLLSCPCYCSYSCPCYCSYSCPCYCSYSCPCYCSYSCPSTPHSLSYSCPATVPTDVPATVPTDVPATVPTDVPSCNADYGCRDHIFQVLSLLGIQANSDMNHLPSAKDRKVARVKEDLTEDGFRRVKPLFWKGVKGWIKVLLPAWNLPDDKVLKKLFSLPSGPFDDKDGADAEGTGALDDHTLVTKNIVQAIKQEKLFHIEGIAGRAKVSADTVVVRLTEEYLAGNIRLAELPVVGQVRTSYQSIGQSKDEASKSPRKKAGCDKPQRKKQKTSNATFDWSKPLLKWSKPQLQTYLAEHNLRTSGNKPELIERVQACMNTNPK